MEARALTDRLDFGNQPSGWIIEAVRNLGALGYLAPYRRDGGDEDQFVQITPAGSRKAEQLMAEGVGLTWLSEQLSEERRLAERSEEPPELQEPDGEVAAVESSNWTGRSTEPPLAGERLRSFQLLLGDAERAVEEVPFDNNADRQQALTILKALRTLSDAPEPPEGVIRDLLDIANKISGIGALFVALIALMS